MWETISCCGADLPARIAAEFAKHLKLTDMDLRLGTDDIASAYRILVSAMPEYNVAAVWMPGPHRTSFMSSGTRAGRCIYGLMRCGSLWRTILVVW